MKIIFKKSFKKQYNKLHELQQIKVDHAIQLFMNNSHDPILNNHNLKGKLQGKKAISAAHNIRMIFMEYKDYTFIEFLAINTHNQVY